MSNEIIKAPRSNNNIKVKFNGSCLIQDTIRYTLEKIVNIYIVYEITKNSPVSSYAALENCLFGAVKLTKNPDIDKKRYSEYGIGFDRKGNFSFGDGFGQNVIFFGADMNSTVHANNRTKNILILGEGFTQVLRIQHFLQIKYIQLILQKITKNSV